MPDFQDDTVKSLHSSGTAIHGESKTWMGVYGKSESGGFGVLGEAVGTGVVGVSENWVGSYGETKAGPEAGAAGVWGDGKDGGDGVKGVANAAGKAAVCGFQLGNNGPGIFGKGNPAGFFEGDVHVTGKLSVKVDIELLNGDCAEEFRVAEPETIEPGTVMVLGADETLHQSSGAYDKRVAGVVSGAGEYRPAIVLDRHDDQVDRRPLAILGKVYCKVDARYGAVDVGDLLTTSASPGHAMKVTDPLRAFGAVIGKALRPLSDGQGLIPILVALQ